MGIVSLENVKSYLKLEGTTSDDARLQLMLDGVNEAIEQETGRKFSGTATDIEELIHGGFHHLILSQAPVISVTSIKDTFSDDEVVAPATYLILKDEGMIYLRQNYSYYSRWGRGLYRWKVTYKAGYADADIPADIKQAALMWIEGLWGNSGGVASMSLGDYSVSYSSESLSMPAQVVELLAPYRSLRF